MASKPRLRFVVRRDPELPDLPDDRTWWCVVDLDRLNTFARWADQTMAADHAAILNARPPVD